MIRAQNKVVYQKQMTYHPIIGKGKENDILSNQNIKLFPM
jgi:hypothetical protein